MATAVPSAILIVNDRKADLVALREALQPLGETVLTAGTAMEGLQLAGGNDVAVAIVDVRMPGVDGFAMVETLRRDPRRRDLPVLFVSALDLSEALLKRVYTLGAADLVTLPVLPDVLRSKVAVFVKLHRQAARERAYAAEVREAAATEVHTLQERFRLLMESASDYALFFLDASGRVTDWTLSAERLLGYSAADAVGQHFRFIFKPEDRAHGAPEQELERAMRDGQSRDDKVHLRRNGSEIPVTGRTIALKECDGTMRGFAKIMRDATQIVALQHSEAKFREIFETANEGIWMLGADMTITAANRRMAEILGLRPEELIGRRKVDFVFPEDAEYVRGLFEERRQGKIQTAIEVRFRHASGAPVWTLLSARPILRDGQFAGALDMYTDITPRRLAQDRLRVFFESSAAGHALIDPRTRRFLQVNRRYCDITGRSEAELLNLTFTDITCAEDRAEDEKRVQALYSGELAEITTEKRYLRPNGTTVWVQLTTTVVRTPGGEAEVQLSVIQDITARKAIDQELQESRTRLRLAIEIADLGVFYHDGESGEITWSPKVKELLGMSEHEPASVDAFLRRIHPDDLARVTTMLNRGQTAEKEYEWEVEYRVVRPDGAERWLKSRGVSDLRTGEEHYRMIGTIRDITAEKEFAKELERQIAERTRELHEKNEQLESFCYTAAHDLRAPLRAINGYADMVMEDIADGIRPQTTDYLEQIRASTKRLDTLVADLLSYSRISQQPIPVERVDLNRIVETVLSELAPEIHRLHARVSVQPGIPAALGDASVLEQVLLNLVGNALKFTPAGQPPDVHISAEDGDGRVRLKVRDRGIGVPREYQERIFKVFERLQSARRYPGTGIGLAIVARAMERLGGAYGVDSEPGQGSTFWIDLERSSP